MNPPKARVLVPPRPNLGPEPWAETRSWGAHLPALGVSMALAIAVIVAGRQWRRVRARRRYAPGISAPTAAPMGEPPSRRERLIALSGAVREVLVARFGPAWRSKTTEEIAREGGLAEAFGAEETARLLQFLEGADRAKFANENEREPLSDSSPDSGEDWANGFITAAGARSERPRPGIGPETISSPGPQRSA